MASQQDKDQNANGNQRGGSRHTLEPIRLRIRGEMNFNVGDQDDVNSTSSSKWNIIYRLDRFLRRWLPGYNYIRGGNRMPRSQINLGTNNTDSMAPGQINRNVQKRQQHRKTEVYLDTGIAKSEFCVKLENILKSKLNSQEQRTLASGEE